ncbi:MAG: hypothetical protein PUE13_04575 [Clostridiales bacterium]|nr:hypothetical protein [Clostridiales bacterium]
MQYKFYIRLAGLTVEMNSRFEFSRQFCRDYITKIPKKGADIIASVTWEQVEADIRRAQEPVTEEFAEVACLYRSIAEQLPKFGCFVFHGAAISYGGKGYLFTAPSGTGKTTHICLWRKFLGDKVDIINGDKPIIRTENSGVLICSAPWAGKEQWQKNRALPLGAICFLNRGTDNLCVRQEPARILSEVMHQVYLPKNQQSVGLTLDCIDKMMSEVPIYRLTCDISEDAVKSAFEAMTGMQYT